MGEIVHLNKSELKNIIHETVKKVLSEGKTNSFINEVRNFNSIIDKTNKTLNERCYKSKGCVSRRNDR